MAKDRLERTAVLRLLPVVFTRAEALAAGLSRHQVTGGPASGQWQRLASGTYCAREAWDAAGADERYRLSAVATSLRWPGTVISHTSAAALWHLPMPPTSWVSGEGQLHDRTWLTARPGGGACSRRCDQLAVVVAGLRDRDVVVHRSARYRRTVTVTGRARTVADCLRHLPAAAAVAFADAAGAAGTPRRAVLEVLGRQVWWPGAERADSAMRLVGPRRESWLESVSAVGLAERGVPAPEPQVELCTPEGRLVARVDDWWPLAAVAGEADGWAKYRAGGLASAQDAERALRREKQREDAVRALGAGVVRWPTGGAMTPRAMDATAAGVRAALDRGEPWRLRAVVRPTAPPPGW